MCNLNAGRLTQTIPAFTKTKFGWVLGPYIVGREVSDAPLFPHIYWKGIAYEVNQPRVVKPGVVNFCPFFWVGPPGKSPSRKRPSLTRDLG